MWRHRLRQALLPLLTALSLHGAVAAAAPGDVVQRPQDDLYRAFNGAWLRDTTIPPDRASISTLRDLTDRSQQRQREIVEALAADRGLPDGSVDQKIARYYRSHLDTAALDAAGLAPLAPWRAQIDAIDGSRERLAALMGRWQGMVSMPLEVSAEADAKAPDTTVAGIGQDGLGLPDRDYYRGPSAAMVRSREAYRDYLETLFRLAGVVAPGDAAARVIALETRLAGAQWSAVRNRDPRKTYNPTPTRALARQAPGFDWPGFFGAAALGALDSIVVSQPSYLARFARLWTATPVADWQLYLQARLLDAASDVLAAPFRDARFAFHDRALQGLVAPRPRWETSLASLDDALGQAVGQRYVQRHFPPEHKARMEALVGQLFEAYRGAIDASAWMGPATRAQARRKLDQYAIKIGYPERWRDYGALVVDDADALGNTLRAGRFDYERVVARVGQPVDRGEWFMPPQTVNAYYNPSSNEIVFPAAILQPPLFDMAADDAANYGAIGAIIGHEISHGFDDGGSQYDGHGALREWWTAADRRAFKAQTRALVAQYGAYQVLPGSKLNGALSLGENIADLAGLQIAFKAYQRSLQGRPSPTVDGLSGEQRFFEAWAVTWREKTRDALVLRRLTVDPHAPGEFRTNGVVVNLDGFHDAFATRPGDKLYKPPRSRIRLW